MKKEEIKRDKEKAAAAVSVHEYIQREEKKCGSQNSCSSTSSSGVVDYEAN